MLVMTLLKRNGVEFENGMCNICMCSPSRSTLFTRLYPAQDGVTATLSNMAKLLRPHYDVHYRGKWHLNKGGMNHLHPEKSLMRAEVVQYGFAGWPPLELAQAPCSL